MSNKNNVLGYVDYFRQLAKKHHAIQHDPNSEDGNGNPGDCKFSRWNAENVVVGLGKTLGFPAILLELYDISTKAESAYDIKGDYTGSFSVVDHALKNNVQDEERALALCETIVDNLLQQIWQDHYGQGKDRCETPFQYFSFNYDITAIGPVLDNEFGWRVVFTFNFPKQNSFQNPLPEGIFLP